MGTKIISIWKLRQIIKWHKILLEDKTAQLYDIHSTYMMYYSFFVIIWKLHMYHIYEKEPKRLLNSLFYLFSKVAIRTETNI